MSKTVIIVLIVILVIGFTGGYLAGSTFSHSSAPVSSVPISVMAAGSLDYAMGVDFNQSFTQSTGIRAAYAFHGSVEDALLIKEKEPVDVFMSAAAGVIPQYLMPNYTKWMVIFASNEMAVTWLNKEYYISPGAFWFENISAPHVIVGVSNSSLDPSGFQAIEMIKLAGILYTNWSNRFVQDAFHHNQGEFMKYNDAWNSWFGPNGTLAEDHYGGGYPVNDSMALYNELFSYKLSVGDLKLTTEEIGLDAYLQSGGVDYALTYKSQAVNQHLSYFENSNGGNGLPTWINLGNISNEQVSFYGQVNSTGPSSDNIGNFPGAPILYSVTIISSSRNQQDASIMVYYLLTSMGQGILLASDFDPISTPFLYGSGPSFLTAITQPVPAYIPATSYEEI